MKVGILVATAFICFQTTQTFEAREKGRGCRAGRCKYKLNSRLRFLRDLSKAFYPGKKVIDTLKTLHGQNDGVYGTYEATNGFHIPKFVCPRTDDNIEMLPCPTTDSQNRIHCIHFYSLCDRKINCPSGEDEDPTMCLFRAASEQYNDEVRGSISKLNSRLETLELLLLSPGEPEY